MDFSCIADTQNYIQILIQQKFAAIDVTLKSTA